MKQIRLSSIYSYNQYLLVLFLFTPSGYAVPLPSYTPYKINIEYAPSYYRYQEKVINEETGSKDYFMSLTSMPVIHAFTLDYRRFINHDWFSQTLATIVLGNVDYDSDGSGYVSGEDNLIFMLDNSMNYCQDNSICTSIGYAFRYLDNDSGLSMTSTGNTGYERENFLHLLPFGLSYRYPLYSSKFSSSLVRWKYYYLLDGWQISHLSKYSSCSNDLKNKQRKGYGFEASLRLYSNDRKWFYGANAQYWKIAESDEVKVPCFGSDNVGSEPENTTIMVGVIVGYHYL